MGSRPSAPVTYRPTPTAPIIYQSVIPEKDFQLARDYVDELKAERKAKLTKEGRRKQQEKEAGGGRGREGGGRRRQGR